MTIVWQQFFSSVFGVLDIILYNFHMKQFMVGVNEAGQRVDRLVSRLLPKASYGEVQKLFRKKCFKVNHSRGVKPADFVSDGDLLEVYLSDDSLRRLGADYLLRQDEPAVISPVKESRRRVMLEGERSAPVGQSILESKGVSLIFEDKDVVAVSKPAGMLTQGDETGDVSMTDIVKDYLSDYCTPLFSPATASRLDRGTSGVLVFAKNYPALKRLNAEMRTGRAVRKYLCVVHGYLTGEGIIEGVLKKHRETNMVELSDWNHENGFSKEIPFLSEKGVNEFFQTGSFSIVDKIINEDKVRATSRPVAERKNPVRDEDSAEPNFLFDSRESARRQVCYEKRKELVEKGRVATYYKVFCHSEDKRYTLVEAELVTGKTHQIRVSMAAVGHPIVGDAKYGRLSTERERNNQLLHAYRVEMGNRVFVSTPKDIVDFLEKYF